MAFDSSRNAHSQLPEAPQPRPELWHDLRDDGIQWEGQVLLAGTGIDVPALLVLTANRFTLICNGEIALEAPRAWLTPEPRLLADNGVRLSLTPQGGRKGADESSRLTLRVRNGRGAAARLVSTITGRLVSPRDEQAVRHTGAEPAWGVAGAATAVALPPLPDFPDDAPARHTWPPVEQHAVAPASPAQPDVSHRGNANTSISAWTFRNLNDRPPSATGRQPGSPAVMAATAAAAVTPPYPTDDHHQFNRGLVWGLRSLILLLLIGAGLYFGRDSLPRNLYIPLPARLEQQLGLADDEPTDVSLVPGGSEDPGSVTGTETPPPTQPDSDGTSGAPNSDLIGTRGDDENENGLGGATTEDITPADLGGGMLDNPPATAPPTPTPEPTVAPVIVEPTREPTEAPRVIEPTAVPTEAPVEPTQAPVEPTEAPVEPTEEPTLAPTEEPVEPTDAPVEPTEEPTLAPTEIPATEEPTTPVETEEPATEVPVTETPTETPVTEAPTEEPVTEVPPTEAPATEIPTEEPEATLESQPPSVAPDSTPVQALASGPFRYTITSAARGETIPELPDLQAVGEYGEWVVLSVYGENWSDTEQVFDMSQFQLFADGEEILLDVGNGWIAGLLGYTPAYGNTDAILWAGGESHPFTLTFLVPTGATDLTLVAGDQTIDLGPALAEPAPLGSAVEVPEQPEYIEATVVEVIDGETVAIEQDGITQTVRYLGIDVPTGDDCYAAEATAANAALVEGQTVRIERQATDTDARGNWVRDVWVLAEDGRYFLVSQALVDEGAAIADISEPNTRFEGWLLGAESAAQAEGRGLWGACEQEVTAGGETDADAPPQAVVPTSARVIHRRVRV